MTKGETVEALHALVSYSKSKSGQTENKEAAEAYEDMAERLASLEERLRG